MPNGRSHALQWAATLPAVSERSLSVFAAVAAIGRGESRSLLNLKAPVTFVSPSQSTWLETSTFPTSALQRRLPRGSTFIFAPSFLARPRAPVVRSVIRCDRCGATTADRHQPLGEHLGGQNAQRGVCGVPSLLMDEQTIASATCCSARPFHSCLVPTYRYRLIDRTTPNDVTERRCLPGSIRCFAACGLYCRHVTPSLRRSCVCAGERFDSR